MLGYVMVGTTNLNRSTTFYDAVLAPLGLVKGASDDSYAAYCPKSDPEEPEFYVTSPINKEPATAGNGTMIALLAETRKAVDDFHEAALASGGTDEGKPGLRPADGSIYYAYARDPDGNKICAYCTG